MKRRCRFVPYVVALVLSLALGACGTQPSVSPSAVASPGTNSAPPSASPSTGTSPSAPVSPNDAIEPGRVAIAADGEPTLELFEAPQAGAAVLARDIGEVYIVEGIRRVGDEFWYYAEDWWNSPVTTGGARTRGWLRAAPDGPSLVARRVLCPSPLTAESMFDLSAYDRFVCMDGRSLTFRALLFQTDCEATPEAPLQQPAWLNLTNASIGLSIEGGRIPIHVPSSNGGPTCVTLPDRSLVEVTGNFDDPAAETCVHRALPDTGSLAPAPPPPAAVVLSCKEAFVATKLRALTARRGPIRTLTAAPGLIVGKDAKALTTVRVRFGPGTQFPWRSRTLRAGDPISVLAGPVLADGYAWYEVFWHEINTSGWVASGTADDPYFRATSGDIPEGRLAASFWGTADEDTGDLKLSHWGFNLHAAAAPPSGTSCTFTLTLHAQGRAVVLHDGEVRTVAVQETTDLYVLAARAELPDASLGASISVTSNCSWAISLVEMPG